MPKASRLAIDGEMFELARKRKNLAISRTRFFGGIRDGILCSEKFCLLHITIT